MWKTPTVAPLNSLFYLTISPKLQDNKFTIIYNKLELMSEKLEPSFSLKNDWIDSILLICNVPPLCVCVHVRVPNTHRQSHLTGTHLTDKHRPVKVLKLRISNLVHEQQSAAAVWEVYLHDNWFHFSPIPLPKRLFRDNVDNILIWLFCFISIAPGTSSPVDCFSNSHEETSFHGTKHACMHALMKKKSFEKGNAGQVRCFYCVPSDFSDPEERLSV